MIIKQFEDKGLAHFSYAILSEDKKEVIEKAAKIGYESCIKAAFVVENQQQTKTLEIDLDDFKTNPLDYTIVDIRNTSETKGNKVFETAINIPLPELWERAGEVPEDKPVVVHCAGGYRSAAGSSILALNLPQVKVLDLSESIQEFKK